MNSKLIIITALSAFASIGVHAFQGEQNPLPPQEFQSTQTRSTVASGALQPLVITNGGTGTQRISNSSVQRSAVRAGALAITRDGSATYGEVTDRKM